MGRLVVRWSLGKTRDRSLLLSCLMILAGGFGSLPDICRAYEVDVNPYLDVQCDGRNGILSISQRNALTESEVPETQSQMGLESMVKIVPGTDDRVTKVSRIFRSRCRFETALYDIRIIPYNLDHNLWAPCGQDAPSLELTLYKNGVVLVKDLIFTVDCLRDAVAPETQIEQMLINERSKLAQFTLHKGSASYQVEIKFSELTMIRRDQILQRLK